MNACPYCGCAASAESPPPRPVTCARCGNRYSPGPAEPGAADTPPPLESDPAAAAELSAEGEKLIEEKRYTEAAVKLQAAADQAPDDIQLLLRLAAACSKGNQTYEALVAWRKILRIDPDHEEALFKTGMLLIQQKRYGQGVVALKRLLERYPSNSQAELMIRIAEKNQREEQRDIKAPPAGAPNNDAESAGPIARVGELFVSPGAGGWIALAFWMAFPVAFGAVYAAYGAAPAVMRPLLVAMMIYAVFASVVVHELGHGVAAYLLGDDTAHAAGRLTFNPFKHVSIIGTFAVPGVVYFLSGVMFGWARPVPFNPPKLPAWPRGQVIVAGTGPFASFALSYAAFTLFMILAAAHNGAHPEAMVMYTVDLAAPLDVGEGSFAPVWFTLLELTALVSIISLLIGVFNLIPVPPLDGSWLLAAILPPAWAVKLRHGFVIGFMVIAAAVYFGWIRWLLYPTYIALTGYYYLSSLAL